MPHPLPPSQPYSSGLRWFLVAVPDEDAFVRAAMAAYTDLGKFYNWGLEGPTDGSNEAAALFNAAAAETLRAWEMSLLDTLIESIDEVEDLLRLLQNSSTYNLTCCDHVVPLPPTPPDIPTVPPTTWGENTTVADEDEWTDLKCGAAHAYVDYLIAAAEGMEDLIAIGGVTIGAIAGFLALLSGAGLLAVVAYEFAAGAVAAVLGYTGGMTFGIAAGDLETYREDVVCAIIGGDPAELRALLSSLLGINYDIFYRFIDFETALSVIATGNYKDANLDPQPRTDCSCLPPLVAGYNLVPVIITSFGTVLASSGGTVAITDNGDSTFTFVGNVGTATYGNHYVGRRTGITWDYGRSLAGWTVEPVGIFGLRTATTNANMAVIDGSAYNLAPIDGECNLIANDDPPHLTADLTSFCSQVDYRNSGWGLPDTLGIGSLVNPGASFTVTARLEALVYLTAA